VPEVSLTRQTDAQIYRKWWARPFFDVFDDEELGGIVTRVCRLVGICDSAVSRERRENPAFRARFELSQEILVARLEGEAYRRAYEGTGRLKFDKDGNALIDPRTGSEYIEKEFSDTLLLRLLQANAPEKYSERTKVTSENKNINTNLNGEFSAISLEQLQELQKLRMETLTQEETASE